MTEKERDDVFAVSDAVRWRKIKCSLDEVQFQLGNYIKSCSSSTAGFMNSLYEFMKSLHMHIESYHWNNTLMISVHFSGLYYKLYA